MLYNLSYVCVCMCLCVCNQHMILKEGKKLNKQKGEECCRLVETCELKFTDAKMTLVHKEQWQNGESGDTSGVK